MSIDRYLHIVHSPWYRPYRKPTYTQLICLLIWTGMITRSCQQHNVCLLYISKTHRWASRTRLVFIVVSGIFMFPYEHFWNVNAEKHNQSSSTLECVVHDTDGFSSSCLFTFVFYYILPLSIIGLCYLRVFIHVRRTGYWMVKRMVGSSLANISIIVREGVPGDRAR